ncbi:hypothetical protein [Chitinophaga silvisoli]|uniref:Lipoprotein n=1 Tax=Chitinophaga silvisoli TaxID=2291814 RepID=A0A3E1NN12_9BACT|nr:hypothetical protein [Chitinophaga silvisoli]RFM29188.1 hypothetical protein DXN04_34005 [Chitinophaga silvisoli]
MRKEIYLIAVFGLLLFGCYPLDADTEEKHENLFFPEFDCYDQGDNTIVTKYNGRHLLSRQAFKNSQLIESDSIIYKNQLPIVVSSFPDFNEHSVDTVFKLGICLNDTSRNFVFLKNKGEFKLVLLENNIGDSCIEVKYFRKRLKYNLNDKKFIDSLIDFQRTLTLFDDTYLVIKYYYIGNTLNYKTKEVHKNWQGWSASYDEKPGCSKFINSDLLKIEFPLPWVIMQQI